MDYTKYRLKPAEEIKEALGGIPAVYILHCQKCYKKFDAAAEPECAQLKTILAGNDIIMGCSRVDFLCGIERSGKILSALNHDIPCFGVIACGSGAQAVADFFPEKPVIALADSVPHGKNPAAPRCLHGISLDEHLCSACGDCRLGETAGICPVSNCAKSLLNGPCGGAKNGRCEIDGEKDCAWEKIHERLQKQGRSFRAGTDAMDYSAPSFSEIKTLSELNRARRDESFFGGLHPPGMKEPASASGIQDFPEPGVAAIFLSQHIGTPAEPLVKPGENVRKGQKIGEGKGFVSSPVHSSISGEVLAIEEKLHPAFLVPLPAVVIENDGKSLLDDSVKPLDNPRGVSAETLAEFLRGKGVVGLGGAMFPSHAKISPPRGVETLLVNGCECEPFLNADNRVMLEHAREILEAAGIIAGAMNVSETVVCVEDNKPDAVQEMEKLAGGSIKVMPLPAKYPQGAERMLVKKVLGREVPDGGLPLDVGAVIFNTGTLLAVHRALFEGLPLIDRVVTVSGDYPGEKGNFRTQIGTPLADILLRCAGAPPEDMSARYMVRMGGPMMGIPLPGEETFIIKGTTGFTITARHPLELSEERECIKCGRCVQVCPMELYPLQFIRLWKEPDADEALKRGIENCFECGACEYVCPSRISIVNIIKKVKRHAGNKA